MSKKIGKGAIGAEFNAALAAEILDRLGKMERIEDICRDEHMPKVRALQGWSMQNTEWGEKFRIAKRAQKRKTMNGEVTGQVSSVRMGRPTLYNENVVSRILERIEDGERLSQVCRTPGMPRVATVYMWSDLNPEFADKLARAKKIGAEVMASEVIEISDDQSGDWVWKQDRDGKDFSAFDHEHVQRSRLRCDNRKWFLAMTDERFRDKGQSQNVQVLQVSNQQTEVRDTNSAIDAYAEFQKLVKGE